MLRVLTENRGACVGVVGGTSSLAYVYTACCRNQFTLNRLVSVRELDNGVRKLGSTLLTITVKTKR